MRKSAPTKINGSVNCSGAVQVHALKDVMRSARVIVPLVLDLVPITSVIDVGCGTGGWLAVFREHGIRDFLGIDGEYVRDMLAIPPEHFMPFDLHQCLHLERQYDLVVSLEVADELPMKNAVPLVESLTQIGKIVLFSAAIPGQTGEYPKPNVQWPGYWSQLFGDQGYVVIDCLRQAIWSNPNVQWWYSQNIMLFIHREHLATLPELQREYKTHGSPPLALVHPTHFLQVIEQREWFLRKVRRLVPASVRRAVRAVLGGPRYG